VKVNRAVAEESRQDNRIAPIVYIVFIPSKEIVPALSAAPVSLAPSLVGTRALARGESSKPA